MSRYLQDGRKSEELMNTLMKFQHIAATLSLLVAVSVTAGEMPLQVVEKGVIPDSNTARNIARVLLSTHYGQDELKRQSPLKVTFDDSKEIWSVSGSIPKADADGGVLLGGVLYIDLRKDTGGVVNIGRTK